MIHPPHTLDSVVQELIQGLADGTVIVEQEAERARNLRMAELIAWWQGRDARLKKFSPERAGDFKIRPLAEVEKQTILEALEWLGGDTLMTAQMLGIRKKELMQKLKLYGLEKLLPLLINRRAEEG